MKKLIVILTVMMTIVAVQAQDKVIQPQISVSGEGKVKVIPDEAVISIAVETKGEESAKVKKENDVVIDKVLKYLKSTKINQKDIKTERVSLYPSYDYNKKKNYYMATQTISITLRDLSTYDVLMDELVKAGVNRVNGVTFQSSEMEKLKSEARMMAVADAKKKAEDFAGALGQKVGKAIIVTDNSSPAYFPPMYKNYMMADSVVEAGSRETLAVGELEITTNVNITFILE
jgi:uncharacterized protein YggE